ncbi:MAG: WecB/TagA/CpsF family glycosyltransferase [Patescibacteria group bacterium]|nr:WecB/TagA/CpsF family glycosyltransferase [Patescibacteria group bacterium]
MIILGVHVDNLPKPEVLAKIQQLLLSDEKGEQSDEKGEQLVTTNPEFILSAQKDENFKNIINNSWLSVPDGYGLRLAAKYLAKISNQKSVIRKFFTGLKIAWWGMLKKDEKLDIIKETITGTDLIPEICKLLSVIPAPEPESTSFSGSRVKPGMTNKKIFLLGGFGDTPRLVMENLKKNVIPSPEGAMESLEFGYTIFEAENIIEKINSFQPTVLFVALNHPKAQKWINENLPKMPSVKLAIGVGGAFDYWAGKIKRAPTKWQGSFEWLYRLLHQPKRLKRIWQASIIFPWQVFKKSWLRDIHY